MLIKAIDPERQTPQYLSATSVLLEIQFNVGDSKEFTKTYSQLSNIKINKLDEKARFFFATQIEIQRIKGLYLIGAHDAVIEQGKKVLEILGGFTLGQLNEVHGEIALTVASSLRAKFNLAEAESFCFQALILASFDPDLQGYRAMKLLHALLKHFLQTQDTKHIQLLLETIGKHPEITNIFAPNTIESLSFDTDTALALLLLNKLPLAKTFLDSAIKREAAVNKIPVHVRLGLLELRLLVAGIENDQPRIEEFTRRLQAILQADKYNRFEKHLTPILAWAALLTGHIDSAKSLIERGEKIDRDFDVYSVPLISVVKGKIQFIDMQYRESLNSVSRAFEQMLQIYIRRSSALPTGSQALSLPERITAQTFLEITAAPEVAEFVDDNVRSLASQAMQMLQRERVIIGARIAEARMITDEGIIAEHVRELDSLSDARFKEFSLALERIVTRTYEKKATATRDDLRPTDCNRVLEIQYRINSINAFLKVKLGKEYFLSRLGIASLNDVQAQLGEDDVMVSHAVIGLNKLAVECITHNSSHLNTIDANFDEFVRNARLLNLAVTREGPPSDVLDSQFPAKEALFVYETLFSASSKDTQGKNNLLIASDPDLTLLPYNALLTAMPKRQKEGYDLKNAPWLITRHSITLVMSRVMFVKQRSMKKAKAPDLPFLAFANPSLNGNPGEIAVTSLENLYAKRGLANISAVRELPALPETTEEVKRLSELIGGEQGTIFSGQEATERAVRSQDLRRYRVLAFATHGLTAGEFDGIAEPALVLTPEKDDDPRADGLLTMTEVSKLSIEAGLVILSACNTAAADGSPSGRGFSGLASAFFGAGARNILASQWPVASFAATRLTTGIFRHANLDSKLTVAEGLQQAMLSFLQNSESPAFAHPRFWAPFILAGDGTVAISELLGGHNNVAEIMPPLATRWDINFGEVYVGDVLSMAANGTENLYVSKIGDPDSKKGRARSVLTKVSAQGRIDWQLEDNRVAAGPAAIIVTQRGPIVSGSIYSDAFGMGAALRAFDNTGKESWRKIVDSISWDIPVGLAEMSNGRIIWGVLDYNVSPSHIPANEQLSGITLITLNESGKTVRQMRLGIPLPASAPLATDLTLTNAGLFVMLSYAYIPSDSDKFQYDKVSGHVRTCISKPKTVLLLINPDTGEILKRRDFERISMNRIRARGDGHTFAAARIADSCGTEGDAIILEISPNLETSIVFQYGGPISKEAGDIAFLSNGDFIMVGRMDMLFAPDSVFRGSLQDNINHQLDKGFSGELFERDNRTWDAYVAVVAKDGTLLRDKVIGDLRGRWLTSAIVLNDGRIITGGAANGTSGWLLSFAWPGTP